MPIAIMVIALIEQLPFKLHAYRFGPDVKLKLDNLRVKIIVKLANQFINELKWFLNASNDLFQHEMTNIILYR